MDCIIKKKQKKKSKNYRSELPKTDIIARRKEIFSLYNGKEPVD